MTTPLPPLISRRDYLARKMPEHPAAQAQGYVLEHRRVYWDTYGPFDLILEVHHRNGDKHDNRPENLELMSTGEHAALHAVERQKHDWDAIIAEYERGAGTNELSAKYGVNKGNISRVMRKRGVAMRPRGSGSRDVSMEQRLQMEHPLAQRAAEMYMEGTPAEDVAAATGLHVMTVLRAVRRRGLPVRAVGRPPRNPPNR